MSVPGIVHSTLDGEEIAARVSLGGEDCLFITPSSTLVYNSEGLLSDESVDEYPHDADRLTLSEGRRKTTFALEYPLEGTKKFTVPASKTDAVLHPVLAGVLNGNGITEPGETVVQTYRFSELTLIITSDRLVKHIGAAVWDGDYEEYEFADVTGLSFEDGSVATQIVLEVGGRPQRIKAPNEEANDLRERLKRALFEYHGVGSLAELNEAVGDDDGTGEDRDRATVDFGDGVDPLDANPPELDDDGSDSAANDTSTPAATSTDPLAEETTAAREAEPEPEPQTHVPDTRERTAHGQQDTPQDAHDEPAQSETSTEPDTEPTDTTFEMTTDESTVPATEHADSPTTTEPDSARAGHDAVLESGSLLGGEIDDTAAETTDATTDAEQVSNSELLERLESLESTVEQQTETIERQQQTIEQLIAELRARR